MLVSRKVARRGGPEQEVLVGGKGSALVWLHGVTRPAAEDALLAKLAETHSVHAPLMPGVASPAELDAMTDIRDLALGYDTLFNAMGLDAVTLCGHSFGGMLAAELAALNPKRVRKLVLLSPLGLWNDAHPIEDLFARPYPLVDELIWRGAEHKPEPVSNETGGDIEKYVELANTLGSIAKYVWPIPDKGLRRRLYRITAPTLVMFGRSDAFVPAVYADEFVREIAGANKLVLPGSHMFPYEQVDEVAAAAA